MLQSKWYQILEKVTNYILLSVLWAIISLPLVTLFPATTAMFGVIKDWHEQKEKGVLKHFFKHFSNHFKKSLLLGIIFWIVCIIFILDILIMNEVKSTASTLIFSLLIMMAVVVSFICVYLFPIMVSYKLSIKNIIKNAFLFSIMYFPTSLISFSLLAVSVYIIILVPIMVFIVVSPVAYIIYRLCNRSFSKVSVMLNTKIDASS
ncbi:YesL family protein [Gracilibacillus marinus]|uniref:YesL family protein n=1 Tax=Gracilibacillus marinus TaxID=630535 RepID=A0ABV8VWC2_9BACI